MSNKFKVEQVGESEWNVVYTNGDKEFAGPFLDQEKADNTCASMNGLMRDWPPEAKSDECQETAG